MSNLTFKMSQVQATIAAQIQTIRLAPVVRTFWLPVSYVMAHVEIESGFDASIKASDYATTGSVGLMQPTARTWTSILNIYNNEIVASKLQFKNDPTDSLSNLLVGMLDLYDTYEVLGAKFGHPLLYQHICDAFNEGDANEERNPLGDIAYYLKWKSAQVGWAMLDDGFAYKG